MNRTPAQTEPVIVVSSSITAVDRATGEVRWKQEFDNGFRRYAVDSGRIFALDSQGTLHCLDVATGATIGKVDLSPLPSSGAMLFDSGVLYVCGDNVLIAVSIDGRVLWRTSVGYNKVHSLPGIAVVGGNSLQPDFSKG
ncbi:MAG: PQQ-binding-like beta-propeller repeat protein [Labilithrix sp.]|nr:PQQ-binding-like beta-propeller repeat protein [Labilithrix sp.]MCW5812773.1 PQQ-binding-like beta-propeller repeat protein [Labilithrix sp.]